MEESEQQQWKERNLRTRRHIRTWTSCTEPLQLSFGKFYRVFSEGWCPTNVGIKGGVWKYIPLNPVWKCRNFKRNKHWRAEQTLSFCALHFGEIVFYGNFVCAIIWLNKFLESVRTWGRKREKKLKMIYLIKTALFV